MTILSRFRVVAQNSNFSNQIMPGDIVFTSAQLRKSFRCFDCKQNLCTEYYEYINTIETDNLFESARQFQCGKARLLCRTCARNYMCLVCFQSFQHMGNRAPPLSKSCNHPKGQHHLETLWAYKELNTMTGLKRRLNRMNKKKAKKLCRELKIHVEQLKADLATCEKNNRFYDPDLFKKKLDML